MSKDEVSRIYDLFGQAILNEKITKNSCGVGFGLLITQQLLKFLCPEKFPIVYINSKKDKGTSISVFFESDRPDMVNFMEDDMDFGKNFMEMRERSLSPGPNGKNQAYLDSNRSDITALAQQQRQDLPRPGRRKNSKSSINSKTSRESESSKFHKLKKKDTLNYEIQKFSENLIRTERGSNKNSNNSRKSPEKISSKGSRSIELTSSNPAHPAPDQTESPEPEKRKDFKDQSSNDSENSFG